MSEQEMILHSQKVLRLVQGEYAVCVWFHSPETPPQLTAGPQPSETAFPATQAFAETTGRGKCWLVGTELIKGSKCKEGTIF